MAILSCKDYKHLVNWLPDGKSFRISDPNLFASTVLSHHLKEAKYPSFKRKLQRWGFKHKTRYGRAKRILEVTFSHDLFQRDRVDLIWQMAPLGDTPIQPPVTPNIIVSCFTKPMFSGNAPTSSRVKSLPKSKENSLPVTTLKSATKKNVRVVRTMRKALNKREFPLKLMRILAIKEHSHIITWQPDGESFRVINQKKFTELILPLYLSNAQSYTDFEETMKSWKFKCVTDTIANEATFQHNFFCKNRLDLIKQMALPTRIVETPKLKQASNTGVPSKIQAAAYILAFSKTLDCDQNSRSGPMRLGHPVVAPPSVAPHYSRAFLQPTPSTLPVRPVKPQDLPKVSFAKYGPLSPEPIRKFRLEDAIELEVTRRLHILGHGG